MGANIFISYRRDDVPGDARSLRDALAAKYGKSSIFMDVDNLLAGQRFDVELGKALGRCQILIAVIGPRWLELMEARAQKGERDYVREEITEAIARKIAVIPVRMGREDGLPLLPRQDQLPQDIRQLVLYQKFDVTHERFARDVAGLKATLDALTSRANWWTHKMLQIGIGATVAVAFFLALLQFVSTTTLPPPQRTTPSETTATQSRTQVGTSVAACDVLAYNKCASAHDGRADPMGYKRCLDNEFAKCRASAGQPKASGATCFTACMERLCQPGSVFLRAGGMDSCKFSCELECKTDR